MNATEMPAVELAHILDKFGERFTALIVAAQEEPVAYTPLCCPRPGCCWSLHGIPDGQPWTADARTREHIRHQAAEHPGPEVDDGEQPAEPEGCEGCETCELATELADERKEHQDLRALLARLAATWGNWHGEDLLYVLARGVLPPRYDNLTARRCTDPANLDTYKPEPACTSEELTEILAKQNGVER